MLQSLSLGLISLAYAAWVCREFYRLNSLKKGRFKTFAYIDVYMSDEENGSRVTNSDS